MSTIEKIFDAPLTGYDILNERRTMHIFCFSSQSRKTALLLTAAKNFREISSGVIPRESF